MSCSVGHRHGLDLALLRLWHRPAAVTLIWEPPYAAGAALKRQKKKKKKKKKKDKENKNTKKTKPLRKTTEASAL